MQVLFQSGSRINKVHISQVCDMMEDKCLNVDEVFGMDDYAYVSDGFLRGLKAETNEPGEWHHYFTKDTDGLFIAFKMIF